MDFRKVEVFQDSTWIEVKFAELEPGDKFRLYDVIDGKPKPVEDKKGATEFICDTYPAPTESGVLGVMTRDDGD